MSAYGNMYFLKADVTAENIWDCIRGTFPDYGLTEAMPKHFSIERDNKWEQRFCRIPVLCSYGRRQPRLDDCF